MNNKGADQSAWMRRLVCAFVVRKLLKTGFLASRPIYDLKLIFTKNPYFFSVCNSCCNVCIYSKYGARGKGEWEHNQY